MSFLKKKRFWEKVDVSNVEGGFGVLLDGRSVKTPEKADLILPTRAAAELVAVEWDAVDGELDPTAMNATRWANVAIDRVGQKHGEVVDMLAAYGGTDLVCYRATHPEGLIAKQAAVWDAPIAWVAQRFGAPLEVTQGIIPIDQPNQSLANLRAEVAKMEAFSLSAFHDLVHISGSLVLSLAVFHDEMGVESAWDASQVDENWQAALWGADEEAVEASERKREAYFLASQMLRTVRNVT